MAKDKRLNIGLLLDDTLDTPDGVQQYVLTLGRWLSNRGHTVHYIVGASKRMDIDNMHPLAKVLRLKFNGNRVGTPLPVSMRKVRRLLAELDLDVLHVQMPYSPFFAAKVIRAADPKTKIVGSFHVLPNGWLESLGARMLGWALYRSRKRIDICISNTHNTSIFYHSAWGVASEIIPNPVNLDRFYQAQARPHNSPKKVVFLGRFVERKGALNLVRGIALLPSSIKAEFHLGGKGPLLQKAKDLSRDLGLEGVITFDGFIDESDKPAYLAQADIAIFPSTGGESFGISLIEPMAAGVPVVLAGRNPGYESVMHNYDELLFHSAEPQKIADILQYWLVADSKLIKNTASSLAQHVKQYDIDKVVGQKILEIYTL